MFVCASIYRAQSMNTNNVILVNWQWAWRQDRFVSRKIEMMMPYSFNNDHFREDYLLWINKGGYRTNGSGGCTPSLGKKKKLSIEFLVSIPAFITPLNGKLHF